MSFSSQFIEVLDALCDKIGIAIDWTSQNVVPYATDLATRIITYEISTSAAWIVIAAIVFLIAWKMTKNMCKADDPDSEWFQAGLLELLRAFFVLVRLILKFLISLKQQHCQRRHCMILLWG